MTVCLSCWRRKIGAFTAAAALTAVGVLGAGTAASASEPPTPGPLIVGGSPVQTAPSWAAAVGSSGNDMWCSGSLVASQWVLTAAHCSRADVIRVGSKYLTSGGTLLDVTSSVRHSRYDMRL